MDVAVLNEENVITNVLAYPEDNDFKETDTLKKLPLGLWIGDKYSTEIPKIIKDSIEAEKIIDDLFSNVSKLELIEMYVDILEKYEGLKEFVDDFLDTDDESEEE